MRQVDSYASLPHYWDHLAPIVDALTDAGVPGDQYGPTRRPLQTRRHHDSITLVAGWTDYLTVGGPVIYVEHGAGQGYNVPHSSYAGGVGFDRAVLFIAPSESVASRWRAAYPDTPAAAVGCPKLDPWAGRDRHRRSSATVAVTFHWLCDLVPETHGAWAHYDRALPDLASHVTILGHGHPRLWRHIARRWKRLGVEPVPNLADVLDRADVLVADNTSAMYEAAAVGIPVVVLNAPWFRRDVHHGGRFWQWADVGVQIDQPDQLVEAVEQALSDPADVAANRRRVVSEVYSSVDGHATDRAVEAIMAVIR